MNKPLILTIAALATLIHAEDSIRTILDSANHEPYVSSSISNYVNNLESFFYLTNGTLRLSTPTNILWESSEAHNWGAFTPDGREHPNPDTVAVNKTFEILPEKHYWQSVGGAYVLMAADGASMRAMASDSTVTWTFSANNSFMAWHSEGITVGGARATSINIDRDTTYVEIDYLTSSNTIGLSILHATDLRGPWSEVDDATFEIHSETNRTATIPTHGASSGFYRATTTESTPAYVEHSNPQLLRGGIMIDSGDRNPFIYTDTLTITNNGNIYRIPAQLVPQP